MLAAEIWHWWIGVVLFGVAILAFVGLCVSYLQERDGQAVPEPAQESVDDLCRERHVTLTPRSRAADPLLVPPAGDAVACAFSGGADSTALVVLAGAAGCRPRRSTSTTACDHRRRRGGRARRRLIAPLVGVPFGLDRLDVAAGPNLEARARAARSAGRLPATRHRSHGRRPGRDDADQPAARDRARRAHRDEPRPHPTRCWPCAGTTPRALCAAVGLDDGRRPLQRRPPVRAQPGPPRGAAAADGDRRARRRPPCSSARRRSSPTTWPSPTLQHRRPRPDRRPGPGRRRPPALARRVLRRWLLADGYPPDAATLDRVLAVAVGANRGLRDRRRNPGRTSPPAATHRGRRPLGSHDGMTIETPGSPEA